MGHELRDIKNENNRLKSENQQLVATLEEKNKKIESLDKYFTKSRKRNESLKEEFALKAQNLEIVTDEILSLQIQNNLLNEKITSLSQENDRLVQRWITKAKQEAERLNDANEFIESLNRK